jgi:acylphosphatase
MTRRKRSATFLAVTAAACLLPLCLSAADAAPVSTNAAAAANGAAATHALRRVHAFVSGRVQGVGFRDFTSQHARGLHVSGWVMNLADHRVELVAEGPANDVEKLLEAVGKGPAGAQVDKVERKDEPYTGEFKRFEVRR